MSTDVFQSYCRAAGLPIPETEWRFHPARQWRFDYAWPGDRLALECEGGVWIGGRHTRGRGFTRDMEKYNAAAARGWRVIRCQPRDLLAEDTLELVRQCLNAR